MCKRPLPADQIEQMRKDWNAEKSKRLEGINESGRACDQKIIAALEQEAAVLQKKYDTNLQDTAQKKSQIAKIKENDHASARLRNDRRVRTRQYIPAENCRSSKTTKVRPFLRRLRRTKKTKTSCRMPFRNATYN